jgi:putative nucleotidyltransferase with HDIG domain
MNKDLLQENHGLASLTGQPVESTTSAGDWVNTIDQLIGLAKSSAAQFDFPQVIEYLHAATEIWDAKGLPEFSPERRIEIHRETGKAHASLGRLTDAIAEYQKVLNICRDSAHLTVKSETFTQIAQLVAKQGDHERALGFLQRAIASFRRLDDRPGICRALRNLGVIYVELGEFEEAQSTYTEAIALAGSTNDRILYADLVNNLGAIVNMRGNPERSLELYQESLEIYTTQNEIRKGAYTRNNIAITLLERGDLDTAYVHFAAALAIAEKIKDASLALIVNINLADLYLKRGETSEATRHCRAAELHLYNGGIRSGHLVETKMILGRIALAEANLTAAHDLFNYALEIAREIGAQFQEAEVLVERGMLMQRQEKPFEALADLESAYQLYKVVRADGRKAKTEQLISSIELLYLQVFDSISRDVDKKDPYTKGHSDRVAAMALLLAREIGLKGNNLKAIVAGALLHDIGKIRISDAVLNKPGRLTDEEFAEIKRHPQHGIELLEGKTIPWDVRPIILYHHERVSGAGYPIGLKGDDIPLGARIVCIVDVFDALTSDRVYRAAYSSEKAFEIMLKESGTTFDAVLLHSFIQMVQQGKADIAINSKSHTDEMYRIWAACMDDETQTSALQEEHA